MSTRFVPFDQHWRARDGLVVVGSILGNGIAPTATSVHEMDGPRTAGDVELSLVDGMIAVRALVRDEIARKKVATGVYQGFQVVSTGSRVERVALVDRPDFDKTAGRSEPALLKLVKPMASKASRYAQAERDLQQAERRLVALRTDNPTDTRRRLEMMHRVNHTRERLAEKGTRVAIDSAGKATMMDRPTTPTQPERQGTRFGPAGIGVDLGEPGHGRGDDAALAVVRDALSQPMNTGTFLRFLNRYADR